VMDRAYIAIGYSNGLTTRGAAERRWAMYCSFKKWSPRKKQIVTFLLCELLVCVCLALQSVAFYDVSGMLLVKICGSASV
jgi:hypothetical protein